MLLHKYRRLLKLKVRVLVEQMFNGYTRLFFEFEYRSSVGQQKITWVINYPTGTRGSPSQAHRTLQLHHCHTCRPGLQELPGRSVA